MKRYLIYVVLGIVTFTFLGCTKPPSPPPQSFLQIYCLRSYAITEIEWNGESFGDQYIWERFEWGLYYGNAETREVTPGSAPVIFRDFTSHDLYETIEIVEVGEGEHVSFTITDSTPTR